MIIGSTQWNVLIEVAQERQRQDEKWGGPEHDDTHEAQDWENFILDQMFNRAHGEHYRTEMIRIAGLAVAAIESYDRLEKK